MSDAAQARFDVAKLRETAGERSFARGKDYFRDGRVQIRSLGSKRVVADVSGTEDYRTILTGRGADIGGECSCPAFEDQGFCKHMVATALAANAAGAHGQVDVVLSGIRQYLQTKSPDQLIDLVLEMAEQYPAILQKLEFDSALLLADDEDLEKRLRKAIDEATRIGTYLDYRKAREWSANVEAALEVVSLIASGSRAGIALKLAEYAIERIGAAFESIDDSDGHIGSLLGYACDIHLAAVEVARPEPVALARTLFQREVTDDFGAFNNVIADYADALGERGLAEYRRLAADAWETASARPDRGRPAYDNAGSSGRLIGILDFFAERDGDVDARIVLRRKNLTSPWDYFRLAEFCLSQQRAEEALRYGEEGLWQFEDDVPDERLLFFVAKLLAEAGRKTDAVSHLQRAFRKAPSVAIYRQLRHTGGVAAAEQALAFLERRLDDKKNDPWRHRPDLFIEILVDEKKFDDAWSIQRKYGASDHVKQRLVAATDMDYPREALEFYAVQVERFAVSGAYADAVKMIGRMERLRTAEEQSAYTAELKVRHGRKRNFMKLLGKKA